MLYASWSIPNEAKQKLHFGRIVLAGSELGQYCLWNRGLTEEEANEWDEFVGNLRPDNDLTKTVAEFRFSRDRPPKKDQKTDLAEMPRELLLGALTGKSATEQK